MEGATGGTRLGTRLPQRRIRTRSALRVLADSEAVELELQLRPELYHSVRRNAEKLRGRAGVPRHEDVDLLTPACHRRAARWNESLAAQVVRGLQRFRHQSLGSALLQNPLH